MDRKKFLKIVISIIALFLMIIILIYSKTVSGSVLHGLNICLNVLIPSMFIFLIVSDFFQETNMLKFVLKPLEPIFQKLFKIDSNLTSTVFFSLICGYPTGAYLISKLLQNKQISKQTATRLMCFCVNSGPAFLIGAISVPFTGNIFFGIILFISQLTAFFVVGTLCSIKAKPEKMNLICLKNKKTISQIFIGSVNRAIKTMAMICGFAILFSAIIGVVFELTNFNFENNKIIKAMISGFFEVTNGISVFKKVENIQTLLTLALISSFGGICVHCQLKAILAKFEISLKKFYAWRVIYCIVSLIVCYFLFKTSYFYMATFAATRIQPKFSTNSIIHSTGLIILSVALLFCDKKNIIINKNLK